MSKEGLDQKLLPSSSYTLFFFSVNFRWFVFNGDFVSICKSFKNQTASVAASAALRQLNQKLIQIKFMTCSGTKEEMFKKQTSAILLQDKQIWALCCVVANQCLQLWIFHHQESGYWWWQLSNEADFTWWLRKSKYGSWQLATLICKELRHLYCQSKKASFLCFRK